MKIDYVTDTMAIILRLENRRLSLRIKDIFEQVEFGTQRLAIPAMAVAELGYLAERRRIETSLSELSDYVNQYPQASIEPITGDIVNQAFRILDIPELHDRLIAATAVCMNAVLITNDPVISESKSVRVIW
ncbi:type II toxin-antitoxin system VapC family toxin [Thiorhodovibrio frisius]|uniref:type II toxin-antitoxin system VapC family toxin n=1 Tax=Thiorhodovibrio frisius TaxID=631362 RepID=UPI000255F114|nr:PIN domain-containing protein [Thiorhodovibrio frisius]